ncbi:MAG: hypothetical protein JWQ90_68 [Hydrocarboniphaga sp.]|uniref:hypothetical protein n=1 Tax=Hydrocarboniphaga sp. TaxID=2033016 RepID=UPI00261FC0FF|nr:hypothetical protein [Hydrocarboniphaga sp.]MDB5967618.1 hypothetical protein [Hydrocarboniphaga sp.]
MTNRRPLAHAVLAIALIGGSAGAQAADGMSSRVASGLGRWIAAQGNAALSELSEDLKRDLAERLQPLLPASDMVEADPLHKVGNEPGAAPNTAAQSI